MKKALTILVAVLLLLPIAAFAKDCSDPDMFCGDGGTVGEEALIAPGGSPPTSHYAWVLPDEDSLTVGTQLYPDLSEERNDIYACVVTSDPQGRDDVQNVYVDVYHPVGTGPFIPCVAEDGEVCDDSGHGQPWDKDEVGGLFKYQVHATLLDPMYNQYEIEQCKLDALNAGLIDQSDFDDIDYWIFDQPEWYMWKAYLPMLYHQPTGTYEAKAWATDTASATSLQLSTFFDWVSTVALEIDFYSGIYYGQLQPSVYKTIQGDYLMIDGDGAPTIKNEGNERIQLVVMSTNLTGVQFSKEIDDFDVKWDPEEHGVGYGQYFTIGGEELWLPDPLELCQTEKMDFSVHADVGLPADTYVGTLYLSSYPWGI